MAPWNKNKGPSDGILRGKELQTLIKERKQEQKRVDHQIGGFHEHPLWHIVLFIGLVVIFFPWSLLLMLFLFGWDGSVQIFRGLVIGTLGLVALLLWLIIWLAIILVIVAMIFG
jgi:hypothetical protein